MFCSNCGKESPDSNVFCTECGAKLRQTDYTQASGRQPWTQQYNPAPQAQTIQPQPAMKWYKFLIYFSLFLAAADNLIFGILNFFGGNHFINGLDAATLYAAHDGLKILDVGYGIVYLAFVPFAFYIRSVLAGFKKYAPDMFYIYSIVGDLISISYIIFSAIVTEGNISETAGELVSTVAGSILYIALNVIYFNKRKHLFVN